ncbi:PAS domain S-box protein [Micromonospora sp. NPDC049679]|uniref:PAS domain S-box protein n=1 Tax=Micromonospora sp. NPDC049679 TaxID=3155920 RepID=UPI00340E9E66
MVTVVPKRSQGLLEAAPDAVVVVTADGLITLVNAETERLFGYRRDELIGQPVEILVPDSIRAIHPTYRDKFLADQRPRPMTQMELSGRRKSGAEFPAEVSLSVVDTEDELLVAAVIRDVTERRQAAEAQARLASLVQSSQEAIMSHTLDGVITSWNPAAEEIYGYREADVLGRDVLLLVPPAQHDAERQLLRRIADGERLRRTRTERVRRDGKTIKVSLTVSPIIDPRGVVVGAASMSRDLTDEELAEAKFQGLLEAAPDAIVGVEPDGRIVLANPQAERLFGYAREQLIGETVEILVPGAAQGIHDRHRDRYIADPVPRPMGAGRQLRARRRDGSEIPVEISLSALQTQDGSIVLAAVRDVTDRLEAQAERERLMAQAERERLESRLQQSQRLESLGQLAGGVAHDFNNLLAVILNYTAFVAEELDAAELDDAERWKPVARDVAQIQRAADRATALTHQLLAFGRQEVTRPRVLDVNEVVIEVEQLLCRTIGEHVRLAATLAPDLWAVKADPGQLEQVLVNLAVNARDAMPGGGTLTIETRNVVVDKEMDVRVPGLHPGRYVQLRVSDTGRGMTSDVARRAFEPFFTTKPKGAGTGLGLATVYGILAQTGGTAQIYSEPGFGTTITAFIPATSELPVIEERPSPSPRTGGGETILVVEDEDAMREVTHRILHRNGYDVMTASGGVEAVELAQRHDGSIHLLLTDVVMPQMLGKDVAGRVTALRPSARVLYMSGYARPVLAEQGTLDPGVRLVEKPFSETELLAAVRGVLDHRG